MLFSEWLANNPFILSNEKGWMNKKEAAKYVGISNGRFTNFIEDGLEVVRTNNVIRVSRKDIHKYLASKK